MARLLFAVAYSMQRFDREGDALPSADAKGDKAARETVAPHRVDELGRQHRAGGADRVAVSDGPALDVDDVLGQAKFPGDDDRDGCEGFIDLGTLDRANVPACTLQR